MVSNRGGHVVLLSDYFASVELDEHCAVRLHFLEGNRQSKVVEQQEL